MCTQEEVTDMLTKVRFVPDGKAKPHHALSTLSGGWRMKLTLTCAMLQKADILLLDELTKHLDVINMAWVENYLNLLVVVMAIIISHGLGLLDNCCTKILILFSVSVCPEV